MASGAKRHVSVAFCFKRSYYGAFLSWTLVFFKPKSQYFNTYSMLASVSERGLCILKVPPRSPGCQQHSMLWSLNWAFGPWATSSALFCSAGCIGPAVKCDQSAPLGPGLGAVGEQLAQSLARSV